ncbi:MAG: hypothetical protein AAGF48_10370 [Pseudomonadota bacterium]
MADLVPVTDVDSIAYITSLKFKNAGRTPALPVEIAGGHCVAPTLAGEPQYTKFRNISASTIIPERGDAHIDLDYEMTFTQDQIDKMAGREAQLWFFCQLTYTDFMDEQHKFRWCWVWDRPTDVGHYYLSSWKTVPREFRGTS